MDQKQTLVAYISGQLQQGQAPDTILQQLVQAGWPQDTVHDAFLAVQASLVPSTMQPAAAVTTVVPQANGKRRGRLKIGWQLLMHSIHLLNNHRYLLRYFVMTWIMVILINGAWIALFWFAFPDFLDTASHWYPMLFIGYLSIYCVINFYAAALSRNILDIYKGERQEYRHYIQVARSCFWPLLVYSLIEATIGVLLRYIIEQLGRVGELIAWLFGTAISLITMFVLPIIMDTPTGGIAAIGKSWKLLKDTWGEGIAAKIGPGAIIGLMQMALAFLFLLFVFKLPTWQLMVALFIVYIFFSISLAVIGSYASNFISVALYYYAINRQVPPGFTADMLDQVFVKSRRQLKKEAKALS